MEVLSHLADASVEAIITDPPYNQVNRSSGGLRDFDKGAADAEPVDIPKLASEFARVCKGSIYVWCATEQVSHWRQEFVKNRLTTRQCCWEKSNPAPTNGQHLWLNGLELCVFARKPRATFNRFCEVPVWHGASERIKGFPCPKPVWLMRELIDASTQVGDTVLDCFMGSGSTGVACIEMGRHFIGVEKDHDYFCLAKARLEQAGGNAG